MNEHLTGQTNCAVIDANEDPNGAAAWTVVTLFNVHEGDELYIDYGPRYNRSQYDDSAIDPEEEAELLKPLPFKWCRNV